MFSYHENKSENGAHFAKGWDSKMVYNSTDVANLISKYASSPCIWKDGIRSKANFAASEWAGLDFDEGMTLDEAIKIFDKYLHVIGTTKNHQKPKGGKVCDRFRVFIKLSNMCIDVDDYELTVKLLIKKHGADKHCYDGGRFFWHCPKIVVIKFHGETLPVADATAIKKRKEKRIQKQETISRYYAEQGELPGWVNDKLREIPTKYTRNNACFRVAHAMKRCGYSAHKTFETIFNSNIPIDRSEKVSAEIKRVVKGVYM